VRQRPGDVFIKSEKNRFSWLAAGEAIDTGEDEMRKNVRSIVND
jgi:hypothetical protein